MFFPGAYLRYFGSNINIIYINVQIRPSIFTKSRSQEGKTIQQQKYPLLNTQLSKMNIYDFGRFLSQNSSTNFKVLEKFQLSIGRRRPLPFIRCRFYSATLSELQDIALRVRLPQWFTKITIFPKISLNFQGSFSTKISQNCTFLKAKNSQDTILNYFTKFQ